MREVLFAVALLAAGTLVTIGATLMHRSAGFATAGFLLALWSWLVLGEQTTQVNE